MLREYDPQGLNLYVYCVNSPLRFIDPWGLAITNWDRQRLSTAEIKKLEQYTADWEAAKAIGDKDGMKAAHEKATAIRSMYLNDYERVASDGYVEGYYQMLLE